ncbi:Sterol-4-alpha-carboxylate 3-dehydrogenase, decarboxylating [Cytospora mali]|uniref:Sterol-4-alpha-carboxylate 3-dehydrogenase, decarboxylating n=1 Tax=Cytospora mali TaxID=578113 RepID=A0A194W742_CYTMA|nr:Sterol-4-alpha-carboxylate 3-dehydrogenase, decarboxylating [Valsa mali]
MLPVLQYPAQKRVYTLTKAEAEADLIAANRSDGDSSTLVVSFTKSNVQISPSNNEYDFIALTSPTMNESLFWDFQRAVSASVGLPVKPEEIKVVQAWVALLGASIIEWVTWIRTFGKGRPALTWETVRLTIITRTLNGNRSQRITGYKPRVSIHEGLAIAGKWFVEEQKKAEATKAHDPKKTI